MRYFLVSLSVIGMLLCMLSSCEKTERPAWLLSESEMEDLLYDYHLAQSMTDVYRGEDPAYATAVQGALDKHHVTQEQLDSNLMYYAHHVQALHEIYNRLADRYNVIAGLSVNSRSGRSEFSQSSDTADVWLDSRFLTLTDTELNAVKTFSISADSSYHMFDNFQLEGYVHFLGLNSETQNNNFLMGLIVTYENDSIQSITRAVNHSQEFLLNIRCDTVRRIQNVSGYMMLGAKNANPVILENVRLLRIHHPKEKQEKPEETIPES